MHQIIPCPVPGETYSLSTTKSKPRGTDSRDHPHGKSHPHRLDTPNEDRLKDRERFCSVKESYDDSFSHSYHDGNRSHHMKRRRDNKSPLSSVSKSDSSDGRYRRSRSKRHKSADEDDLTRPWMREEEHLFTTRIRNFESLRRTRMPNNVKTYDEIGDPEDHVKIFQAAAQVERWAMPTWCHTFNSTLIGASRVWFDELPPESIDSHKDLKVAFLAYFMQQKKYVKTLVEIHNIKQKDGETIEDFMKRFKVETGRVKGALECMRISGFMHGVNNLKLTKRLNEHVSKTMEEMMITTTAFIRGEVAAASKKKGDANHSIRAWMNFMIVRSLSPYNGMIGRPGIREIQAAPSTIHGMLKFPFKGGIVTIRSTVLIPTECTSVITSSAISKEERTRLDNFKVALHPNFPDQKVAIRGTLSDRGRTELCSILKKNLDIFAWQPSDMIGVPCLVAEHRLNIREGYSPVRQKKRGQAPERAKAIQAEVQKLVEAGIMREVYYHDWLSNPVMVKKHDDSWRLCVDFTDLNKAYAYKGYHQIQLAEPDEEKSTFHTGQGNIEVYVKDLVVKSYTEAEMLRDIEETFRTLRKINMKLIPKKCVFGLAEGVFLGYVVTLDGIKPYLEKTAAVLQLPSPQTIKEILADFLIEMPNENPQAAPVAETQQEPGTLFTDGSSCMDGSAEYEALIAGLRIAAQMGVKNAHVNVDSKLVSNQVLGMYVAKKDNMVKYLDKVKSLVKGFTNFLISQVVVPYAVVKMCWTDPGGIHRPITRSPQQPLTLLTAPWPFYKWGIDIAGPFPEGLGKIKFLIVAMDYFTKWIEAKVVATITGGQVKKFVWDNIVCRFYLPGEIVLDNGKQFSDNPFKDWCDKLNITQRFASVKHPQSNGLVERANQSLEKRIKARLEIGMPTYRTAAVDVVSNDEELRLNLDLLEERRERAAICKAKANHAVAGGKLGPKWEGPYEVTEALGEGAYKLRSMDGTILPRKWNIANLKRCYL
nr:reverse transcriptase domain-containing protein [Tanacetum cinerariifolium]